jgi:heme-degrading monooxygenase HmoA
MSVFMILHVKGDPATFERYASEHADTMRAIVGDAKKEGLVHHAFAAGDGEVVVVDEWPDEDSFRRFFESQQDIPKMMQEAGAQGAPDISFFRKLETPDVV